MEEGLSFQKIQMYKKLCVIYNTLKQAIFIITTTKSWCTTKNSMERNSDHFPMNYILIALKIPLHPDKIKWDLFAVIYIGKDTKSNKINAKLSPFGNFGDSAKPLPLLFCLIDL
jgi:hypothetical protein